MRPRLIILHAMLLAILIAAWRAGLLWPFALLGGKEIAMLVLLGAYACVGLAAAWRGNWARVDEIANSLPAWGLAMTGIGLLLAAAGLHSLTPAALSQVFRELVFSVAPNIVGVFGFAWLTVLSQWARLPMNVQTFATSGEFIAPGKRITVSAAGGGGASA